MFAMSNPVEYSIEHLADVSKDIPNMVVQLSFLVMSGKSPLARMAVPI